MLTQKTNIHRSELPEIGSIGKLVMGRNRWGESIYHQNIKSSWICISFPVCDNVFPSSRGIHTAFFKSLQYPKLIVRVSGFYFEEN